MMNKLFISMIAVIVFPWYVSAQMDDFIWSDASNAQSSNQSKLTGVKYVYTLQANSNYFYQPDWFNGTLTTTDGEIYRDIQLRYDAFNDQVVAYNKNVKALFVPDKYSVQAFTVDISEGITQEFRKITLGEFGSRERYFEVLYDGNVTFLSYNRITERTASLYKNRLGKLDNRHYHLVQQQFLLIPGKPLLRIYPGRKSILSLFPEQKRDLRRLFRQYRIPDYSKSSLPLIVEILDIEGYF